MMMAMLSDSRLSLCCISLLLLSLLSPSSAYKLSSDGQADIGAYHVQPGRCSGVETRLGHQNYLNFFRTSPFHTTFTQILTDPSTSLDIDAMDATSLCAFNPSLTEGYGGGFDELKLYLVYSRCIYGTNEMRVLCGAVDASGKPLNQYANLIQATCPTGTRCKNLCATMRDPSLTSKYAAKQVQLAQCIDQTAWQRLTDLYRPNAKPVLLSAGDAALVTPITNANLIGDPESVTGRSKAEEEKKPDDPKKPNAMPKPNPAPPATAGGGGGHRGPSHLQISTLQLAQSPANKPAQPAPKDNTVKPASPAVNPAPAAQQPPKLVVQKAPTEMGFRKRSLLARHRRRRSTTMRD